MVDEEELTRKAIAEIMREMDIQKEADKLPQLQERKKNPLGRPNKDFLDRTLNSVMTHNKRESDRNYRNCQRQLQALDNEKDGRNRPKREKYRPPHHHRKERKRRKHSGTSESSDASESSSTIEAKKHKNKKSKKIKKKKKHKKQQQPSSSSSSSSSTMSSSDSESIKSNESDFHRKNKKHKEKDYHTDYAEGGAYYQPQVGTEHDPSIGFYVDPNMALAAMAYNHMNQLLQQQQQQQSIHEDLLKEELENDEEKVDIPSDLSLTYYSAEESELNVSLNSSSAEEDENGILTFNLSSDEERKPKKTRKPQVRLTRNVPITAKHKKPLSESSDNESIQSHISLESDVSESEKPTNTEIVELSILSSSSSDSDCQEVVMESTIETKVDEAEIVESRESTEGRDDACVKAKEDDSVTSNKDDPIKAMVDESVKTNVDASVKANVDESVEAVKNKSDEVVEVVESDEYNSGNDECVKANSVTAKKDDTITAEVHESVNANLDMEEESVGLKADKVESKDKKSVVSRDDDCFNAKEDDSATTTKDEVIRVSVYDLEQANEGVSLHDLKNQSAMIDESVMEKAEDSVKESDGSCHKEMECEPVNAMGHDANATQESETNYDGCLKEVEYEAVKDNEIKHELIAANESESIKANGADSVRENDDDSLKKFGNEPIKDNDSGNIMLHDSIEMKEGVLIKANMADSIQVGEPLQITECEPFKDVDSVEPKDGAYEKAKYNESTVVQEEKLEKQNDFNVNDEPANLVIVDLTDD